ncbi:MAG TPA: YbaK/EbsC family protein [Methylomirabilota bacterium]|nr:YbaK/EbsC family protein [Methylomirabilota bacterium]
MADAPGGSIRRVQEALTALGLDAQVVELERSARTAAEAAAAVGCRVDQIAKSLVFRLRDSGRALLVITSGANRVDEGAVGALAGEPLDKADAEFVREQTGFAIGGVAPVGHARPVTTLIDADLLKWPEIWAAAGRPNTVFRLTPSDLVRITSGRVVAVK